LLISKKMESRYVLGYWAAQVLGGIVAAACLLAIANGTATGYDPGTAGFAANGYGAHSPGQYGLAAAALTEILLTFLLVLTVIGATDIKAPAGFAGIPIGLVLTLIHLVGIPVTNTSVNPARSIGPALFVGGWALQQLWLFILAPLLGAGLAAVVYRGFAIPLLTPKEAETALPSETDQRLKRRAAGA
jgi:aquaporin Z